MLICNSNVKHELSSSEYPTRRKQCNEALKLMGLESYREANLSHLQGEIDLHIWLRSIQWVIFRWWRWLTPILLQPNQRKSDLPRWYNLLQQTTTSQKQNWRSLNRKRIRERAGDEKIANPIRWWCKHKILCVNRINLHYNAIWFGVKNGFTEHERICWCISKL